MSSISGGHRSNAYALAARVFGAEIDLELYRRMREQAFLTDPELDALPDDQAVHELAVEYCRLFIGPLPECPPYASVHRREALLGGRARARMEALLERAGFEVDGAAPIASPDHISVPLALMAWAHAEEDPTDSLAREVLLQAILPWAPTYLEEVARCSRREIYRLIARMTSALLEEERRIQSL
jgi:TorA maturation chaperone TorD